jgi:hypothetical protein
VETEKKKALSSSVPTWKKKQPAVNLLFTNSNHHFPSPAQVSFFSKNSKLHVETTQLNHENKTK